MAKNMELGRVQQRVDEFRRELAETPVEQLNCRALERRAQEITSELGRALMGEVFRRADTQSPTVEINGEQWGNRRVSPGTYTTIFGEIDVERSTYQRVGRGRVAVPMELRLGIVEDGYTPQMTRIITHSAAVMTAEDAAGFFAEVGVATVSSSTVHRVASAMAARHETMREQINADVREADGIPKGAVAVQVALDGVMVPQDGEHAKPRGRKTEHSSPPRYQLRYELGPILGPAAHDDGTGRTWHEASVGTVSFFDEEGFLLKTTYLARMPEARKATLVEELHDELRTVLRERPDLTVCLASDGANYHWTVLTELAAQRPDEATGDVLFLTDFYHVAKYLTQAAEAVAGEGTPEAKVMAASWRETMKEFAGGADRVLKSMRYHRDRVATEADRVALQDAIDYVAAQRKQERTGYAHAIARNLPIGTGITEAAAKTVVGVRMKRAGARYSEHGGQTIMLFRTAVLSRRFDSLSQSLEVSYAAKIDEAA
jgi:hypothetical protein